jgi:hypothetical protein
MPCTKSKEEEWRLSENDTTQYGMPESQHIWRFHIGTNVILPKGDP